MYSPEEFHAAVRAKYPAEFSLHEAVATSIEQAILKPRRLDTEVERAADMLMIQACKAHASVYVLAEQALIEDAATITRRLLELAIQAGYITGGSNPGKCTQRAGCYLASLWRSMPPEWRQRMSKDERTVWETYYQTYQPLLESLSRWGPNWSRMFTEVGAADTYRDDYSLLSSIAHGSPAHLIQDYAHATIQLRPDAFVPMVLVFGSRYALAIAERWNDSFHLIDQDKLSELIARATQGSSSGISPT